MAWESERPWLLLQVMLPRYVTTAATSLAITLYQYLILSKVAPLKLRAPIQTALVMFSVFMFGLALGIVRIFVPNVHEQAFRNVFAIQWPVGVLVTT
jgi:hypothetical protein